MSLSTAGLVVQYALNDPSFVEFLDSGPHAGHLDSNNAGTGGLVLAGTAPAKRVDCLVSNQPVRLCRYLGDSGDPIRAAIDGAQQVRIVLRGRWGSVPDYRTWAAVRNWGTQNDNYGWDAFALFHDSNKLFCKWLDDFPLYNSITRPTDGATVDHTYEFQIDSTQGSGRMQAYLDGALVFSTNTAVALNSAIALPADVQIALFNAQSNQYGWRAFSPPSGISYFAIHVGEAQSATLAADTHAALALDDDSVGGAPPDVISPTIDTLALTGQTLNTVAAAYNTDEAFGTTHALAASTPPLPADVVTTGSAFGVSSSTPTMSGVSYADGDTLYVVQVDPAGNPSNMLSVAIPAYTGTEVEITGLVFPNSLVCVEQADAPDIKNFTYMLWERRDPITVYSGGPLLAQSDRNFNGGTNTVMAVTHDCAGGFDPNGQRIPGVTGTMFHEIAGLGPGGVDRIASDISLVQVGETQESYPQINAVWVGRALTCEEGPTYIEVTNWVDVVARKVIRQRWLKSTITADAVSSFLGSVPWWIQSVENYNADVFCIKLFSEAKTAEEIQSELYNLTNTPLLSDCWFSNVFPVMDGTELPDLKVGGAPHPFTAITGSPGAFTELFDVPASAPRRRILIIN